MNADTDAGPHAPRDAWRVTEEERRRYDPQWAISRELEEVLLVLLEAYRPRSILETGPGVSSILLLRYARVRGARTYHLDHRAAPNLAFVEHLRELGLPTEDVDACELTAEFYDLSQARFAPDERFELLLLDGPPESRQRASETAMEFLRRHGTAESIIIQDDTHRRPEESVVVALQRWYGAEHYVRLDIADGTYTRRRSTVLVPRDRLPDPGALTVPSPKSG